MNGFNRLKQLKYARQLSILLVGIIIGCNKDLIISIICQICYDQFTWNINQHKVELFNQTNEERLIDEILGERVRVLCWILTGKQNHELRAKHVKATWAKRCNKYIFMSSHADESLPSINLNVREGRDYLWSKTRKAFKYIHAHYIDHYDWFLKADDDTFIVIENLKLMLLEKNPNEKLYFGCRFKKFAKRGYMSGGAGYILSNAALRQFNQLIANGTNCAPENELNEDIAMGICMDKISATFCDTRDALNRHRFLPLNTTHHLALKMGSTKHEILSDYLYYPMKQGMECCSDYSISFHEISGKEMYMMEYFIYHLKVYSKLNFNIIDVNKISKKRIHLKLLALSRKINGIP